MRARRAGRAAAVDGAAEPLDLGAQFSEAPLPLLALAPFVHVAPQSLQLDQKIFVAALATWPARAVVVVAPLAQVVPQAVEVRAELVDVLPQIVQAGLAGSRIGCALRGVLIVSSRRIAGPARVP